VDPVMRVKKTFSAPRSHPQFQQCLICFYEEFFRYLMEEIILRESLEGSKDFFMPGWTWRVWKK